MENMLGKELQETLELRNRFEKLLLGEHRNVWLAEGKNFVAKRECWVKKTAFWRTKHQGHRGGLE